MNVLSLFDGISCGQLALKNLGITPTNYFASEIDQSAIDVTMKHFPNTKQLGDVCKVQASDLPKIDLLLAGSPCQGFSSAGKGLGLEDPRSKLYFEFERLLKEVRPTYFLLENVVMLSKDLNLISSRLGYEPVFINSGHFSIAERRRYYWSNIPIRKLPIENNKQVISDVYRKEDKRGKYHIDIKTIKDNERKKTCRVAYNERFMQWSDNLDHKEHNYYSQTCRAYYRSSKYPCVTCTQPPKFISHDENSIVYPTIREIELMIGLPEGYTSVHNAYYKRLHNIGNGWDIPTIEHILQDIQALLDNNKYQARRPIQMQLFRDPELDCQID